MGSWLRDYGAAIGPALAFIFGLVMLFVKDRFEGRQRRAKSRHLVEQLEKLALASPPTWIPVPEEGGYATGDANRGNYLNFQAYYSKLLAAKSFLDANEKNIAEAAVAEVLQRFYDFKWRFLRLVEFVKSSVEAQRPLHKMGDLGQLIGFRESLLRSLARHGVAAPPAVDEDVQENTSGRFSRLKHWIHRPAREHS